MSNNLEILEKDPILQFKKWHQAASIITWPLKLFSFIYPPILLHQPNSMILATSNLSGQPSARVVLFKGIYEGGFTFYTNYESRKAEEIAENPLGALVFHWILPERQIRIEGVIKKLPAKISDSYWNSRPLGSRISAISSPQSKTIPSYQYLEKITTENKNKFFQRKEIPRPPFWGGYVLIPKKLEFWELGIFRLHRRVLYSLNEDNKWSVTLLAP
jgi:pyridoxamine 5'-phosphate oxidase